MLIGSQRYQTTLRAASRDRLVIAGWLGLAHGTHLHLVLDRGRAVILECEVIGATTLGIELARMGVEAASDTGNHRVQRQEPAV